MLYCCSLTVSHAWFLILVNLMLLLQVFGQVSNMRDALIQIVLRLRDDVLKDREDLRNSSTGVEALYAGGASLPVSSVLHSVSSGGALSYDQRGDSGSGLGLLSSSGYGYGSLSVWF